MKAPHARSRVLLTHTGRKILKNAPQWGYWGGPKFCLYPKSYFFCDLKLCAKFHNPRTTPSGRKVCGTEKKKREKNNPKNSGHLVLLQRLRAAYALRSDQHYGRISNSRGKTTLCAITVLPRAAQISCVSL